MNAPNKRERNFALAFLTPQFYLFSFSCCLSFGRNGGTETHENNKKISGERGSTSLLRDVSHEWPQMNELRDWTWRALETKGKLFRLYEDSFSCVCVLIEPASCTYFFFVFYHSLLSLSCHLCSAQRTTAAGSFYPPVSLFVDGARSRIREWNPSHTQVSQLLFFTSWFRHLLSIQLNTRSLVPPEN